MKENPNKGNPVRYFSKKYGSFYSLRYYSPITGKLKHVPLKKSGRFPTAKEAMDWAHRNLQAIIGEEIKALERQNWRSNATIVRHFHEYSVHRHEQRPRSARQDLSMLTNFGIPFYLTVIEQPDPNKWGEFNEELLDWLKTKARTHGKKKLAVSSCNKVVNALNHFLKWMRKKKIIEYASFRQLEGFGARDENRRGSKDLLPPEVVGGIFDILNRREDKRFCKAWRIQAATAQRVMELLGMYFTMISEECPAFIKEEFERKGFRVYGSIYLDSQPEHAYIRRIDGTVPRVPLKWRREISVDCARTIPILNADAWNDLVDLHEATTKRYKKNEYGPVKDTYLLFDFLQRNDYNIAVREACQELGLKSCGTHVHRHNRSTEFAGLRIDPRIAEIVLGHKRDAHERYVHIVGQINAERLKALPVKSLTKIVVK